MEGKMERNGVIEFWRCIFAFLIAVTHSQQVPSYFTGDYTFTQGQTIGVEFFFILSGFLMAKSALKYKGEIGTDTGKFILKKYLSILPVYLFSHILSAIVISVLWPNKFVSVFAGAFFEPFMLQATSLSRLTGYPDFFVQGTWYLSTMLLTMLVLFPILRAKRNLFLNVIAPCVTLFVMHAHCLSKGNLYGMDYYGMYTRALGMICLGCFAYNICSYIRSQGTVEKVQGSAHCLRALMLYLRSGNELFGKKVQMGFCSRCSSCRRNNNFLQRIKLFKEALLLKDILIHGKIQFIALSQPCSVDQGFTGKQSLSYTYTRADYSMGYDNYGVADVYVCNRYSLNLI